MSIENIKKAKKEDRRKLIISIIKIVLLVTIVVSIPLYIWFFHGEIISQWKSVDDVVAFLEHYETESIIVYIVLQIIQVIISVLPGQIFQMAAGYLYGFWAALLFAMTGAIIGTAISFMIAKVLGRDFLHILFGEERISYYVERLNSKRMYTLVFLIYLIPGIPKDMVSYASGISEIRFKPFIILSSIGRIPGMAGSLLMGTMLEDEKFGFAIGIGLVAVIMCILCVVFKDTLIKFLDKAYEKIS